MKSGLLPKNDEIILSTITALIVGGLIYQGCSSLWYIKVDKIFKKDPIVSSQQ